MTARARRIVRGLALAACAVIAVEAAAFLIAWWIDGAPSSWSGWQHRRQAVAHGQSDKPAERAQVGTSAASGVVLHPYVGYVADPTVVPQANELGFEGALPVLHPAPGTVVIGVVGGAMAHDFAADGMDDVRRRVAELRGSAAPEIVVVNLARAGYKEPQQLTALAYALSLGAVFDVVLNVDGHDTLAAADSPDRRRGVHPAFPQDWYLLSSSVPDVRLRRAIGQAAWIEGVMVEAANAHSRRPWRWSLLSSLVWDLRQRRLEEHHARLTRTIRAARDETSAEVPYRTTGPRIPLGEGRTVDLLATLWRDGSWQLHALCRENGTAYLHFLQPLAATDRRSRLSRLGADLAARGVAFTDLGVAPDAPALADGAPPLGVAALARIVEGLAEAIAARP